MTNTRITTEGKLAAAVIRYRCQPVVYQLASKGSSVRAIEFSGSAATIVAKVRFGLGDNELVVIAPDELHATDRSFGDNQSRGLHAPADLVPLKLRPEVTLVGQFQSPGGQPTTRGEARLAFGSIDKRIFVACDRWMDAAGRVRVGAAFAAMPIVYERAAMGSWNMLGPRGGTDPAFVPNLSLGSTSPTSLAEIAALEPACFAAVPASWPVRRGDPARPAPPASFAADEVADIPLHAHLPMFNAAPSDQQLQAFAGDEVLTLAGFWRESQQFRAQLPAFHVAAVLDDEPAFPLSPDTLFIDTEKRLATITYRAALPLSAPEEALRVRVSLLTGRAQSVSARPPSGASSPASRASTLATAELSNRNLSAPVPFASNPAPRARVSSEQSAKGLPFGREGVPAHIAAAVMPAGSMSSTLPIDTPKRPQPGIATPERPTSPAALAALAAVPSAPALVTPPAVPSAPALVTPPAAPSAPAPVTPASAPAPVARAPIRLASSPAVLSTTGPSAVPSMPRAYESYTPVVVSEAFAGVRLAATPARATAGLRLLGFLPRVLPHLRNEPSFRFLLDALDEQAFDPVIDDPDIAANPAALEDRRDVEHVLRSAASLTAAELRAIVREPVAPGQSPRFRRPLVVLEGTIELGADELDLLRATVAVAQSYAAAQAAAVEALQTACAFLASPGMPGIVEGALGLVKRVRGTFEHAGLAGPGAFDAAVGPALLERRSRSWHEVLGRRAARGSLELDTASFGLYVDQALEPFFPEVRRLPARALVRVHPSLDQLSTEPVSLELVAFAVKMSRRGGLS